MRIGVADYGRFCELGAGNIGMDNAAILRGIVDSGYDGWVFVEHDTHLRDPLEDLAVSREYIRAAGF
jgi:sugar phosphate isomerase/epimerase